MLSFDRREVKVTMSAKSSVPDGKPEPAIPAALAPPLSRRGSAELRVSAELTALQQEKLKQAAGVQRPQPPSSTTAGEEQTLPMREQRLPITRDVFDSSSHSECGAARDAL